MQVHRMMAHLALVLDPYLMVVCQEEKLEAVVLNQISADPIIDDVHSLSLPQPGERLLRIW